MFSFINNNERMVAVRDHKILLCHKKGWPAKTWGWYIEVSQRMKRWLVWILWQWNDEYPSHLENVYNNSSEKQNKVRKNETNASCLVHTCTWVALFPLHSSSPIHHFQMPPLLLPLPCQHQPVRQKIHWLLPVQRWHCVSSKRNIGMQSVTPSSRTSQLGISKFFISSTVAVVMGEPGCKKFRHNWGGRIWRTLQGLRFLSLSSSSKQGALSHWISPSLSIFKTNVILQNWKSLYVLLQSNI